MATFMQAFQALKPNGDSPSVTGSVLFYNHPLEERLKLNSAIFLAAFLYSLTSAFTSHLRGRTRVATTACCIHLLAACSYFLMSHNWVPLVATANSDRYMVITRIFEWSVTVPMMLTLIGWLIDPDSSRVNTLRGRMMLCLIVGGFGPLLKYPLNMICYAYSCYLQLLVSLTLHGYFCSMKRKLRNRYDRLLIWVVHTGILTLLTLYPLVWFFTVELNVISLDWEMWIYANLDISAKLLLTSVLSNLTAAAYDYDIVDFPKYLNNIISSVGVPSFAISRDGLIAHWNTSMEGLTNGSAADVLYLPIESVEMFTPQAVVEIKKAMAKRPAGDGSSSKKKNTIILEMRMKGNPQETHRADFYVIYNTCEMDPLPAAIFVEASSTTSSPLEAALEEFSRQHFAVPNKGATSKSSSSSFG